MTKRCLIADKMHESIIPLLQQINITPDYQPDIRRAEMLQIINNYHGLIIRSKTAVDRELIERASQLTFIGRAGAGLDQLDMPLLEQRNIHVVNAPEGNRDALAEHAIGMLLSLLNHLQRADQQVRAAIWDREGNRGTELMGKTVGLIGYGHMGQAFARRLGGFGVRVLAYDKYRHHYSDIYAQEVPMSVLMAETDILSLHVPLTDETRFMVDEAFLNRFRKDLFLLNTARGELLTFQTIYQALNHGKLRGAALDVLENEKLQQLTEEQQYFFQQISQSDRVLFTPHVAGWTFESYEKINQVLAEKLKALNMA